MKKRIGWAAVVTAILLVAAGFFWRPWRAEDSQLSKNRPETAMASYRNIQETVLATGKIMPQVGAEVNVGARISGRLERLHVAVGDPVRPGQLIAEIEKEDLKAAQAECLADIALIQTKLDSLLKTGPKEVARAESERTASRADLTFARSELERKKQLLDSGSVGKQAWEEALRVFEVALAQGDVADKNLQLAKTAYTEGIKQLKAEMAKSRASLQNALVTLSYATIKSPIGGVVASVSTREGETVAAGLNAPTFVTIIDLDRLQLDAWVDEVDIGKVQIGQEGLFTVDAYPKEEFHGRIKAIYPKPLVQENVVTYDCIIAIESPYAGKLKPQMTANVSIVVEDRRHVLVIPLKAVRNIEGKSLVYRKEKSGFQPVHVVTGWQDDETAEIIKGLSEGDEVLLSFDEPL